MESNMKLDPAEISGRTNARIVKTAVAPRPIAWISTVSPDGTENLAPFSSYNYIDSSDPVVVFNTSLRENGEYKDTARNALSTEEFAINIVTEEYLEQVDQTGQNLPPEENEFELSAIPRASCRRIRAPRVAEAPVTIECTLFDHLEIHDRIMILGEVEYYHISDDITTDGVIDETKVAPIGRLGGPFYTRTEPLDFQRENY
jgi:flavin reductase (DIM6/NTAB) family NADH-FMN oxidoreductase RutF